MDFIAGYDTGINKGIATVANHHISSGKKMWHWGIGDFGDMWCSNLTDENGPYIELMTGIYTDNQPDFTWIAPYESKAFEQYWYPIRDIGEPKNASIDAAMNMEERDGALFLGINVTGTFKNTVVTVKKGDEVIYTEKSDMDPTTSYLRTVDMKGAKYKELTASLVCECGKELTEAGRLDEAEQIYMNGVNMPKSYGEAKTFFNQESHIFYYLAKLYAKMGKADLERKAYEKAAIYKAAVSELSLFRAWALKALGRDGEACEVLDEMLRVADNFIVNKDLRTYCGVGSPSPCPLNTTSKRTICVTVTSCAHLHFSATARWQRLRNPSRSLASLIPTIFASLHLTR